MLAHFLTFDLLFYLCLKASQEFPEPLSFLSFDLPSPDSNLLAYTKSAPKKNYVVYYKFGKFHRNFRRWRHPSI